MPILEMWLLIEVGSRIGVLPTVGLVMLTAMLGLALLRQQGFATLLRANRKLEAGQMPAAEVAEGLALAIGGALLITPGFVTDAIGFACLLPLSRQWLVRHFLPQVRIVHPQSGGFGGSQRPENVINGEFVRVDPRDDEDDRREIE